MGLVEQHHALNRPEHPVCSICIANYNGAALLDDCLTSVLVQQGGISIEIIVHDDASTDDSVALLRERYPQVEVLASEENVGFCVSNNRMVEQARGDYVLLLNNDAALYPDALITLLSTTLAQSPPGILTLPQYDWDTGALVDRGCLLDPFYNPVPNTDPSRREVAMVIGACLWVARDVWDELGGFPDWIESIGEDLYVCCVARLYGRPVQVAGGSGYRHRQGRSFGGNRVNAGQLQTTYRRRALSERNKTAVLAICTPSLLVWPLLLLHASLLVFEGVMLTIIKRDASLWRQVYRHAILHMVRNTKSLFGRRRTVQRRRSISLSAYFKGFVLMPRKLLMLLRHGVPELR